MFTLGARSRAMLKYTSLASDFSRFKQGTTLPVEAMLTDDNQRMYPVLFGNTVKVCSTNDYAGLPCLSKFMVKERLSNSSKAKLVLKHSEPKM